MVAKTIKLYLVISVAFGTVSASELSGFYVFVKNDRTDLRQNFFQDSEKTVVHYNLLWKMLQRAFKVGRYASN